MSITIRKLGIIAGGGDLPVVLAEHLRNSGAPYAVARVHPFADHALESHPGAAHDLGAMGARIQLLKDAGCSEVVIVGRVPRPDLSKLEWDEGARAMLPALMKAAPLGDDALLSALADEHVKAGLHVIGVHEAMADLLAPHGLIAGAAPSARDVADINRAALIVEALGRFDVGQGAVVCDGLALAVEAQEGTDEMLRRVAGLRADIRGTQSTRRGVLVKRPKPEQDLRMDLPVIGVNTLALAADAGLAGVVVEAERALIVRREDVRQEAERAGLFVLGMRAAEFL